MFNKMAMIWYLLVFNSYPTIINVLLKINISFTVNNWILNRVRSLIVFGFNNIIIFLIVIV